MKINEFTLPENVINLMKEQLENSLKTNSEFGFAMCAKDTIIESKNVVRRTETEIFIERCPSKFKSVGTFHTHPNALSEASAGDLLNACDHIADCIGGVADNKIKCYVRKKEIDPIDCTKEFSELTSTELDFRIRDKNLTRQEEFLFKERERLSTIKPRTRKADVEIREIGKKIKEHNVCIRQYNKEHESFDQTMLRLQNKYFDEIEITP